MQRFHTTSTRTAHRFNTSGTSDEKAADVMQPYVTTKKDTRTNKTIMSYELPKEEFHHFRVPILYHGVISNKMVLNWPRTIKLAHAQAPHTDYEFPMSDITEQDSSPTGANRLYRITLYYLGHLFENSREISNSAQTQKVQNDFIRDMKRHWMRYQRGIIDGEEYIQLLDTFTQRYPAHNLLKPSTNICASEQYALGRSIERTNQRKSFLASIQLTVNPLDKVHPLSNYAWLTFSTMAQRVYGKQSAQLSISTFDQELKQIERAFDVHRDANRYAHHVRDAFKSGAPWASAMDIASEFDKACYLKARSAFIELGAHWAHGNEGCDGCGGSVRRGEVLFNTCENHRFCVRCAPLWTQTLDCPCQWTGPNRTSPNPIIRLDPSMF